MNMLVRTPYVAFVTVGIFIGVVASASENIPHSKEQVTNQEGALSYHHKPGRYRLRTMVPHVYQSPTFGGQDKGHFMVKSIAQWSLAGGAWAGMGWSLYTAIVTGIIAGQSQPLGHAQRFPGWASAKGRGLRKRHYRTLSIASGVAAGLLAIGGSLLAWQGEANMGRYKLLRAQQTAELNNTWGIHPHVDW